MRILNRKGKIKGIKNELNIPEVDSYCYLGIKINQTLKLDTHINILRQNEMAIKKKIGMLKPSLINTKSRLIVFKTILKSKYWYATAIIWHFNPQYIKIWDSILYRLLKLLFCIKSNVRKELLFKTLGIETTEELVSRTINKMNDIDKERQDQNTFAQHLSIKSIKMKLNCLFNPNNKNKKWNWLEQINNEHVIKHWPKTENWRIKCNQISKEAANKNIYELVNYDYQNKSNFQRMAKIINDWTEELVMEYLI